MVNRVKEVIGIQEAMDNLAAIAEIDMESPSPIGVVKKHRIVTQEEEFPHGVVQWLSAEESGVLLDVLDATYRRIRQHLQSLYENPETNWEGEKVKKGIAAMMTLVGESADKMDRYLAYRLQRPIEEKISEREEFRTLQRFYVQRFSKKFQGEIQGEEAWEEEWNQGEAPSGMASSLKDFEAVRNDQEYELFYIRNEEGTPYFKAELLRNIKLTVDFETEGETFEEDPFLQVRAMRDRDLQVSAVQILGECKKGIEGFLKLARKFPENQLVQNLGMAILALFLAANPRNLLQNTTGKSCLEYFSDFHQFLRRGLRTAEYQKWVAYAPEKSDKEAHCFLDLLHLFCRSFFYRSGGIKQEAIGMIHRSMRKGEEAARAKKKHLLKGETIWNRFLLEDEDLRSLMTRFPNGPLFKILDLIREEEEEDAIIPFDPIGQGNLPSRLFEMVHREKKIDVLRIPSPTRQAFISKAEVIDEFRGFLRSYATESAPKVHLLINLQDRSSWQEVARSRSIESLQKNAEFSGQIQVLTLPKNTDFYHQNNESANLNQAEPFIDALKSQFQSPEEGEFFLPSSWKERELQRFLDTLLPAIHKHFFHSKNSLTRRNREDFIEIFYWFFLLKTLELTKPTSLSFTCKDAIDTGATATAGLYAFTQLLKGDFSTPEEHDFFRYLLYAPALFLRERAVDAERFHRTLSALERFQGEIAEHRASILKLF